MKFGLVTIAYKEERFIGPFVKHYLPLVDRLLVLVSNEPWYGEAESIDWTPEIADKCGAEVYVDHWQSEAQQRNAGLTALSDCDWIFTLDPDEFFTAETFTRIKGFLATVSGNVCAASQMLTYWKDSYRIDPPESHKPVVAVRGSHSAYFTVNRGVNADLALLPYAWALHHLSWARTNEEVWSKLSHFSHNVDFDVKKWYDEVWTKWEPNMRNFHPVNPSQYAKAIEASIPKEIKELFDGK
jgi:glycosyltransferase involved in cell wall biosynthesis